MNELQTLAYLTAIKMMMTIPVYHEASLVTLRATQDSYKMILDILPEPKPWQVGIRYVLWRIGKENAAIEKSIDSMVGWTRAFGGSVQEVGVLFGTLPS